MTILVREILAGGTADIRPDFHPLPSLQSDKLNTKRPEVLGSRYVIERRKEAKRRQKGWRGKK